MAKSGSVPWLVLAAIVCIGIAVFLVSALFMPFANEIMGLPGWRGSDLGYANDGMRMIGDFVTYLLAIIVFGIGFGFMLDARRGI